MDPQQTELQNQTLTRPEERNSPERAEYRESIRAFNEAFGMMRQEWSGLWMRMEQGEILDQEEKRYAVGYDITRNSIRNLTGRTPDDENLEVPEDLENDTYYIHFNSTEKDPGKSFERREGLRVEFVFKYLRNKWEEAEADGNREEGDRLREMLRKIAANSYRFKDQINISEEAWEAEVYKEREVWFIHHSPERDNGQLPRGNPSEHKVHMDADWLDAARIYDSHRELRRRTPQNETPAATPPIVPLRRLRDDDYEQHNPLPEPPQKNGHEDYGFPIAENPHSDTDNSLTNGPKQEGGGGWNLANWLHLGKNDSQNKTPNGSGEAPITEGGDNNTEGSSIQEQSSTREKAERLIKNKKLRFAVIVVLLAAVNVRCTTDQIGQVPDTGPDTEEPGNPPDTYPGSDPSGPPYGPPYEDVMPPAPGRGGETTPNPADGIPETRQDGGFSYTWNEGGNNVKGLYEFRYIQQYDDNVKELVKQSPTGEIPNDTVPMRQGLEKRLGKDWDRIAMEDMTLQKLEDIDRERQDLTFEQKQARKEFLAGYLQFKGGIMNKDQTIVKDGVLTMSDNEPTVRFRIDFPDAIQRGIDDLASISQQRTGLV